MEAGAVLLAPDDSSDIIVLSLIILILAADNFSFSPHWECLSSLNNT